MAGRIDCCRYEASLDELLDDDVMTPVLRSAGLDAQEFRDMIAETARRFDDRRETAAPIGNRTGPSCRRER